MSRKVTRFVLLFFVVMVCVISCKRNGANQREKAYRKTKENIELTLWTYYSAAQQEVFLKTVDEFNLTRGKELNITVHVMNPGSIGDLDGNLLSLTDKNFTQDNYPDMAFMYRDAAEALDSKGYLVDFSSYFSKEELDAFVPGFLEEGKLGKQSKGIKILPVGKSTEILYLNETDWKKFADATGCSISELATREGLVSVAEKYYQYTDALTETPNDGKALFGQEDFANFMLIGAKQMGADLISQDAAGKAVYHFPKDVMYKLWKLFYVPYIKGYFSSSGRYRSDDVRTGEIISYVSTSASYLNFPKEVILSDEKQYPIESAVLPAPEFVEGEKLAVQQGAGIAVIKGKEKKIRACMEFLRWLTAKDVNSKFTVSAGYLPVKSEALNVQTIDVLEGRGKNPALEQALDTVSTHTMYTIPAVEQVSKVRDLLENDMREKAMSDRKAIDTAVASGSSREDAIAEYDTEENFGIWYDAFLSKVEKLEK